MITRPEILAIQKGGGIVLGQSRDCQCYSGVRGYSDRGVVGYGGIVLGQSRDCQCYSGVRGYSDIGVVGYGGIVLGQSRDCQCYSGVWDTLTEGLWGMEG